MRTKNEAIFTLYLGVVNHWVCLVIHKTKEDAKHPQFYLLDSSNLVYLDKLDEQLPEIMLKKSREKVLYGMKYYTPFFVKMSI